MTPDGLLGKTEFITNRINRKEFEKEIIIDDDIYGDIITVNRFNYAIIGNPELKITSHNIPDILKNKIKTKTDDLHIKILNNSLTLYNDVIVKQLLDNYNEETKYSFNHIFLINDCKMYNVRDIRFFNRIDEYNNKELDILLTEHKLFMDYLCEVNILPRIIRKFMEYNEVQVGECEIEYRCGDLLQELHKCKVLSDFLGNEKYGDMNEDLCKELFDNMEDGKERCKKMLLEYKENKTNFKTICDLYSDKLKNYNPKSKIDKFKHYKFENLTLFLNIYDDEFLKSNLTDVYFILELTDLIINKEHGFNSIDYNKEYTREILMPFIIKYKGKLNMLVNIYNENEEYKYNIIPVFKITNYNNVSYKDNLNINKVIHRFNPKILNSSNKLI